MDGYVDTLMRSDTPAAANAGNSGETRGEMARLFTNSFRNGGDLKPADREYVAKVVAARTGMSQADADKRVNDVVTQNQGGHRCGAQGHRATGVLADGIPADRSILRESCRNRGGGLRDGTWGNRIRR